jgi:hypothetical protein
VAWWTTVAAWLASDGAATRTSEVSTDVTRRFTLYSPFLLPWPVGQLLMSGFVSGACPIDLESLVVQVRLA